MGALRSRRVRAGGRGPVRRCIFKTAFVLLGLATLSVTAVTLSGCTSPFSTPVTVVLVLDDVPDEAFRTYLSEHVDQDEDDAISEEEAAAVTSLGDTAEPAEAGNGLCNLGIADLTGIEVFPNLESLACANNNLTDVDLSQNSALAQLDCSNNSLTDLDLSANVSLAQLNCSGNYLASLDVSANTSLVHLDCSGNDLSSLDVSGSEQLASISCAQNEELASLELPASESLEAVQATDCALTSIDVSQAPNLTDIEIDDGVAVSGVAIDADEALMKNTAFMAGTYALAADPTYGAQPFEGAIGAPGDSAEFDAQLVYQTIYSTWHLAYGESTESQEAYPTDPFGLATADGVTSYILTDDAIQSILTSYYGEAPDDLSYLADSSDGGLTPNGDGTWTLWLADGAFACTVQAANYTTWGPNLSFDLAMFQASGLDEYHLTYYRVTAEQSDESLFGYRLVSLAPADDLSETFSSLAAQYAELTVPYSFVGTWAFDDYRTFYDINADGTCRYWTVSHASDYEGTWTQTAQNTIELTFSNEYMDSKTIIYKQGNDVYASDGDGGIVYRLQLNSEG